MYLNFARCFMDRDSKKLVCPECGCENINAVTVTEKQKTISRLWTLIGIVSTIIFIAGIITISHSINNIKIDISKINGNIFLIVLVTMFIIPLMLTLLSIIMNIFYYNMPKSEIKVICINCKRHLNLYLDF